MTETYYDVLGVGENATQADVTAAYRSKVKRFHPDVSDRDDARERFEAVVEAERVLGNERERARYDRLGHEAYVRMENGAPPRNGATDGATPRNRTAAGTDERRQRRGTDRSGAGRSGRRSGTGRRNANGRRNASYRSRRRRRQAMWNRGDRARERRKRRDGSWESNPRESDSRRNDPRESEPVDGPWTGRERNSSRSGERRNGTGAAHTGTGATHTSTGTAHAGTDTARAGTGAARWARHAATGDGEPDDADAGYAVHEWEPAERTFIGGRPGVSQEALAVGVTTLLLYPGLLYSSVTPAFPLAFNLLVAAGTLLLVGYLITVPAVGIPVFGTWSVLAPLALHWRGYGLGSLPAVIALLGCWIPLAYAIVLVFVLRY